MSDDDQRKNGTGETLRAAFVIVLAGVLLGVGFNALGRASRPPRGLDWVKHERKLPSLEELQGGATDSAGPTAPAPSATPAPGGGPSSFLDTLVGVADAATLAAAPADSAHKAPVVKKGTAKKKAAAKAAAAPAKKPAATTAKPPAAAPVPTTKPPAGTPAPAVALPTVPDTKEPIEVQLATAKKFFDAKAAVFVDAREKEEFVGGHIAGAHNVPFDDAAAKPALLDPFKGAGKPIIVYCEGGDCEVSKSLAWNMIGADIHKVLVFTGGYGEWEKAGFPVEKGAQ